MADLRGGGFSPENMAKMQTLRKDALANAMKVLTDDQKKQIKELTGEPLELKPEDFFRAAAASRAASPTSRAPTSKRLTPPTPTGPRRRFIVSRNDKSAPAGRFGSCVRPFPPSPPAVTLKAIACRTLQAEGDCHVLSAAPRRRLCPAPRRRARKAGAAALGPHRR